LCALNAAVLFLALLEASWTEIELATPSDITSSFSLEKELQVGIYIQPAELVLPRFCRP
jgi:hypothetical protein